MSCEKYLNLIDDLVEGELDEQTSGQVNLHVFACSACASVYKNLKQEKEIYARYLFGVEPSSELWTKLQTKLESEPEKLTLLPKQFTYFSFWKAGFINLWRFSPALVSSAAILVFGIVLFNFLRNEKIQPDNRLAQIDLTQNAPKTNDINKAETSSINHNHDKTALLPKRINLISETKPDVKVKQISTKEAEIKRKTFPPVEKAGSAKVTKFSEEQLQVKALENEAARQIEKVELLLRSFRNAEADEGSESFDVAYEKEQARRLLEKNVRLRRNAENYGSFYTEEILSKVEPYLLDISNLDNKPAAEKVRDIKERVKNQNIIASLQIY